MAQPVYQNGDQTENTGAKFRENKGMMTFGEVTVAPVKSPSTKKSFSASANSPVFADDEVGPAASNDPQYIQNSEDPLAVLRRRSGQVQVGEGRDGAVSEIEEAQRERSEVANNAVIHEMIETADAAQDSWYDSLYEDAENGIKGAWQPVEDALISAKDATVEFLTEAKDSTVNWFNGVVDTVSDPQKLSTFVQELPGKAVDGAVASANWAYEAIVPEGARMAISSAKDSVVSTAKSGWEMAKSGANKVASVLRFGDAAPQTQTVSAPSNNDVAAVRAMDNAAMATPAAKPTELVGAKDDVTGQKLNTVFREVAKADASPEVAVTIPAAQVAYRPAELRAGR